MRLHVHKVGLTASLAGLAALWAASFATVAPNRVATGEAVGILAAIGPTATAVLCGLWLACLAMSLVGSRRHRRRLALARGLAADGVLLGLLWFSGVASVRLLADAPDLARYSIGGGAWLSAFFAFAVIISSRREAGARSVGSLAVAVIALLGVVALVLSGHLSRLGLAAEYRTIADDFWGWTGQHVAYSAMAVGVAIVLGISIGILAHARPRLAEPVFTGISVFQTIPGLAMIGIVAVPLGIIAEKIPAARSLGIGMLGWAPVVVALTLYALLAIVRNTYAGLNAVPADTVDAGFGMGMAQGQVLRKVQLPLSAPIVFSGVRTASQQTIANAALGVFVAAGTLGRPIFGGVSQTASDLVLLGSIALVALALTVDIVMRGLQRFATPRHMRRAS